MAEWRNGAERREEGGTAERGRGQRREGGQKSDAPPWLPSSHISRCQAPRHRTYFAPSFRRLLCLPLKYLYIFPFSFIPQL